MVDTSKCFSLAGSNRLMHHKIKALGMAANYPPREAEAIVTRFGPAPAAGTPDTARLRYDCTV